MATIYYPRSIIVTKKGKPETMTSNGKLRPSIKRQNTRQNQNLRRLERLVTAYLSYRVTEFFKREHDGYLIAFSWFHK